VAYRNSSGRNNRRTHGEVAAPSIIFKREKEKKGRNPLVPSQLFFFTRRAVPPVAVVAAADPVEFFRYFTVKSWKWCSWRR